MGPVIIIEDDDDDQAMLKEIFEKLNYANDILFFTDSNAALDFLNTTVVAPFLIISDINMPRLNGKELRRKIHENARLHLKCLPYLFITTAADRQFVIEAYSSSVQGFFKKPASYAAMESLIVSIMNYWGKCAPLYP